MRTRRIIGTTALACALAMGALAPGASAAPPAPLPDGFYATPATLDLSSPGAVLRSRPMPPVFAVAAGVEQLQFTSTDSRGRAIPAVTTVLTPPHHQPGAPAIVYAHSINSLGLACSPSNALYSNDPNVAMREAPLLNAFLAMGWTVILPDHLGPDSAYGAARMGGQILLDSARAARNHRPADIGEIVMAGYSGGGMAASFAAAMAPDYAPELPLVAAAIGGVPADIEIMAEALGHNAHPAFGIAAAVAAGLEREYPEQLPISDYLTPEGRTFWAALGNACVNQILGLGFGRSVTTLGTSWELFYSPTTREILRANSIRYFDSAPRIPIYEFHGSGDPLIPVGALDETMAAWRSRGTPVTQAPVPVPEHLTAAVVGMPLAVQWLAARLSQH